jgi:hypothetical protein
MLEPVAAVEALMAFVIAKLLLEPRLSNLTKGAFGCRSPSSVR